MSDQGQDKSSSEAKGQTHQELFKKMVKNKDFIKFYKEYKKNLQRSILVLNFQSNRKDNGQKIDPELHSNVVKEFEDFINENSFYRK